MDFVITIPSICLSGSERSLDVYDSVDRNDSDRAVRTADYCDRDRVRSMHFINKIFSTINMDMEKIDGSKRQ